MSEVKAKRTWTRSDGDAEGIVRVTFALYATDGVRVRGNRQRSLIVNGSKVSTVHARALALFGEDARTAHNKTRDNGPLGGEKND